MKNNRIEKITTNYVAEEDRVMVSCQLTNGKTLILWLTQRLLKILLPNIIRRLGNMDQFYDHSNISNRGKINSNKNETKPEPVSPAEKNVEEWLITSVDISNDENTIILMFKRSKNDKVKFIADSNIMKEWIGILNKIFEKACWYEEITEDYLALNDIKSIKKNYVN